MKKKSYSYKDSGVDIDRANEAKKKMKELVASTFNKNVLSELGNFGGMFALSGFDFKDPVLVSSADGVGTKLKVAFLMDKHDTVGEDLVNHCVNDILVQGAFPLFFLDYIATGKLNVDTVVDIVKGLSRGCRNNNMVLIGGETAEMPDFYSEGEYDLAGVIVGIVERNRVIDGNNIVEGDILFGLSSSGLHTNGYTLARKIFFDHLKLKVDDYVKELGTTVGEELLKVHKSYLKTLKPAIERGIIKGLAHITGGGLLENIPRILPEGVSCLIKRGSWDVLPVFKFLQERGNIEEMEMYRVFNMGIGMVVIVGKEDGDKFLDTLKGEKVFELGKVVKGNREVILNG